MRRQLPILTMLLLWVWTPTSTAQTTRPPSLPQAQKQKNTQKQKPTALAKPRFIVPGVGGAVPIPPKPPQPAGTPVFGPLIPGQGPADVVVTGRRPNLPGFPQTGGLGDLVALPTRPANPLLFGVNAAWGDNGGIANWDKNRLAKAKRLSELLRKAGVTAVRIRIQWADIERTRGKYNWNATDRFIRYLANTGVTLIAVVEGTPTWARDRSPETEKLLGTMDATRLVPESAFYGDLGRFAMRCAKRYQGKIAYWEFWSEPDDQGMLQVVKGPSGKPEGIRTGVDPKTYTELLAIFARNVKRVDRLARVAIGGLRRQDTEFLAGIYAHNGRPYFDAVALLLSSKSSPLPFEWVNRCHDLMEKSGDGSKTVWITEWGWAVAPANPDGIGALHQARLLRESLNAMRERPFIELACYHSFNDWRRDERFPGTLVATGLVTYDLRARPAFLAFREVATGEATGQARTYHRVSLIGVLPFTNEGGVRGTSINVTVDAGRPGSPLSPVWQGFAQGAEVGGAEEFESVVHRLKVIKAKLVRFDPFPNPEMVAVIETRTALAAGGTASPQVRSPGQSGSELFRIDWRYADSVVDALARAGAKPMLNLATMPTALSSPTGNTRLPRNFAEWASFVETVAQHYKGRGFYYELSDEPNAGLFTVSEWLRFYDTTARAIVSADPTARVGGPSTRNFGLDWIKALIDHCAQNKVPLHFVSWHSFDVPPAQYAAQVSEVRAYLQRHPELKDIEPIITAWNASASFSPQNDSLFAAAHAASVVEQLLDVAPARGLFYAIKDGKSFRNPNAVFQGRWGMITSDNRPKAVYNAFRLLSHLDGMRLPVGSEETSIRAIAARRQNRVSILIWHYLGGPAGRASSPETAPLDIPVRLRVHGLPWPRTGTRGEQWVVDSLRGNVYGNATNVEVLRVLSFQAPAGDLEVPLVLAPYSLTLVELEPAPHTSITVTARTSHFLVYGGSQFALTATVRNTGARPQRVALTLSSSDPALVPEASRKTKPVTIPPGESRPFVYSLKVPLGKPEAAQFYQMQTGGSSAGVAVKFCSPVVASLEPERVDLSSPGAGVDSLAATALFDCIVQNRSDTALKVGLVAGKSATSVAVPARHEITVPLAIVAPSNAPGNYEVPVQILLGEKAIGTRPAYIGVPALCRYAARKPRINGDLSEWVNAFPIALDSREQVKEKVWQGLADLSAQVLTQWDEEYFYIAASVTDDTSFQIFSPEDMWRGDSVQFALDTRRNAKIDREGYDTDDYEFGMAAAPIRGVLYRFAGGGRSPGVVSNAQVSVQRVGNRTIYEAAIPWPELEPMVPKDGTVMGFSVRVNDSDGGHRGYMEWPGGMIGKKEPGRFIALRLVKQKETAPSPPSVR